MEAPVLDHIVVNARTDLDGAERLFRALGFALTPRGHHSLGSINHLAMFAGDYLELIGVPEGQEDRRPEVGRAAPGLNGLVFRVDDVAEAHARLVQHGLAGTPPKEFSRPVALDDGTTRDAAFRTVTAAPQAFPAGRLYFCQHLTPELLWRPEWLTHPNGVTGFAELVTVAPDPAALAGRVAGAIGAPAPEGAAIALEGGCVLSFLSQGEYSDRFGALARDVTGRPAVMAALAFRGPAPAPAVLDAAGVAPGCRAETAAGLRVALEELDCVLEFRPG